MSSQVCQEEPLANGNWLQQLCKLVTAEKLLSVSPTSLNFPFRHGWLHFLLWFICRGYQPISSFDLSVDERLTVLSYQWLESTVDKHYFTAFFAPSSRVSTTYKSQSTATSKLMSWVGRPTAVRISSIVTSPALGMLAAPTLARVAVKLQKQKPNGSSRKRTHTLFAYSWPLGRSCF